ncbi:hypothetical protein GCM10022631_00020 [Deinococcus rubellus]|uniref:helix-turn-helix domain-containing protein n=1 Tax=Deinococcus rubellus TaxID=1889240 RepID=UPI0031EC97D0
MTRTHWTLAETLRRHGKNVSALVKASGLSKNTVYDIVNGKSQAVTLETLDKLLSGLEQLTRAPVTLEDVLRREQGSDIDPELLAQAAAARPFNWEELRKTLPTWTDEERAEDERHQQELKAEKLVQLAQGDKRLDQLLGILDGPETRSPTEPGKRQHP